APVLPGEDHALDVASHLEPPPPVTLRTATCSGRSRAASSGAARGRPRRGRALRAEAIGSASTPRTLRGRVRHLRGACPRARAHVRNLEGMTVARALFELDDSYARAVPG